MISSIRTFLRLESASGILLILAAALAMLCANSGLKHLYESLLHPVSTGITLGLFLGKPLGVFLFCWAGIQLGIVRLPMGVTAIQLYGVAILCGIGFTMSLFIGALAFEELQRPALFDERIGIPLGSLLSAMAGYLVLWLTLGKTTSRTNTD